MRMSDLYLVILAALISAAMLRWAVNYTMMQIAMARIRKMPPPYVPPMMPELDPFPPLGERCKTCDHELAVHIFSPKCTAKDCSCTCFVRPVVPSAQKGGDS